MARGRRTQRAPRAPQQEGDIAIIPCVIKGAHNTTIRETEDFYKAQKTVKDHCRRAKVYGEGAERIGLKKLCKVCFEIEAQEKGIKRM